MKTPEDKALELITQWLKGVDGQVFIEQFNSLSKGKGMTIGQLCVQPQMTRLCYYNLKPEKLYQYLGTATPAGSSKVRDPVEVYQDNETGQLYFRTRKDFSERMSLVVANTEQLG